jgi:hypothetical protein
MPVAPQGGSFMTILGKILVIVTFVFSLVTGALIIMVFLTRTNWKSGYDALYKNYQAQKASIEAYNKGQEVLRDQFARDLKAKQDQITDLMTDKDKIARELQAEAADKKTIEARAQKAEEGLAIATRDLKGRELEVQNLRTVMADKDKKMNDLEKDVKDFRDRMTEAEIAQRSEHQRNILLLEQLQKMAADFEKLQASKVAIGPGAPGAGPGKRPPVEDLKGRVLETDTSGLVTISLGSDSGLRVGDTLEVFRLEPKPEYVGVIRVVDTHFKHAVARPVMPLRAGPVQKEDIVASRIH